MNNYRMQTVNFPFATVKIHSTYRDDLSDHVTYFKLEEDGENYMLEQRHVAELRYRLQRVVNDTVREFVKDLENSDDDAEVTDDSIRV